MMNKEKTLFIFEGARTENKFVEKLEVNFLEKIHAIKCVYDAEIYQLYRAIKKEDKFFFDVVQRNLGVFNRIMQNTGDDCVFVHAPFFKNFFNC